MKEQLSILAQLSRQNIELFYNTGNGRKMFEPFGSNISVPLALSFHEGNFYFGHAAELDVKNNGTEAFDNLFDHIQENVKCGDVEAEDFVAKVVLLYANELCRDRFRPSSFKNSAEKITLFLLFETDVMTEESEAVVSSVEKLLDIAGIENVKVESRELAVESVKFFQYSPNDDWSQEENAMVVRSDNKDLSIKCLSLSDYSLVYEHVFKNQGGDPRFEWAVKDLWMQIEPQTYLEKEKAKPSIEKALSVFLKSNNPEMYSIELEADHSSCQVFLSRQAYNMYSPPSHGSELNSTINSILEETGFVDTTTGIVLQQSASGNIFFHESFNRFDPISDETNNSLVEIRNQILDPKDRTVVVQRPGALKISVSVNPDEGGTVEGQGDYMKGVKCILTANPNKDFVFNNWVENNVFVSSKPVISFDVESHRSLIANFTRLAKPVDGDYRFAITETHSIVTEGGFLKKKKIINLKLKVEVDHPMPGPCVLVVSDQQQVRYNPNQESLATETLEGITAFRKGVSAPLEYSFCIPSEKVKTSRLFVCIWPEKNDVPFNKLKNNKIQINL